GSYSLSKATLNMLAKLYAHEFSDTHIAAFAPGLIDTAMQDYLCDERNVDAQRFPSVTKLRKARGTENMPTPSRAADLIAACLPELKHHPSGVFLDIRSM
ncbi:MAG: alcohol dehydrogenase, partial [Gammaproteobacteria bacterium]|nr:alcohol dehydrogenase [Gammaproteobacteria bacterium]